MYDQLTTRLKHALRTYTTDTTTEHEPMTEPSPDPDETERVCAFCGTARSDIGTRSSFLSHLTEEHPEEALDWLLDDWQRNFRSAVRNQCTSTHDALWEFTETQPVADTTTDTSQQEAHGD